jgi:hypothetical protein
VVRLSGIVVGIFVCGFAASAISQSALYRNDEYQIILPIPPGTLPCIPPAYVGNGADHGPQILLGTNDARLCSQSSGKRYVNVFASYNSSYPPMSLQTLLETECQSSDKATCTPAPADLRFHGMKSVAGRSNRSDGSIEIIVATQAGKLDSAVDSSAPSINYEMFLHTDLQHFDDDLVLFRTLLKTIKIAPHVRQTHS